jgi:hypothetical protein
MMFYLGLSGQIFAAASGATHFGLIAAIGVLFIVSGIAIAADILHAGEQVVRLMGSDRPIRRALRQRGAALSDSEIRLYSRGWGSVLIVAGVGWLLLGLRVLK